MSQMQHEIGQATDRPYVQLLRLGHRAEDFGSIVLHGATHALSLELLAESGTPTEIPQFRVEFSVKEDVFGLEVSVDDVLVVQDFDS